MAKENAVFNAKLKTEEDIFDSFDLDELEAGLQGELENELEGLEFLEEERKKISNPDNLGEIIQEVIWDQFINQIAATAGKDFIKENRGLRLDLRDEAHIQTTENFAKGKIATHNAEIDYKKRYDDWQSNFVKDEKGNVVTHKTRSGKEEATLVKGARKPFDEGRPKGSVERHTDMDHTVSAAEIIRDPSANAHMTREEQIAFANSKANLNEMDSSLNRSKGDKSMTDWLDNPNAKGQKPDEIFDITAEDDAKLRQKDVEAREEYEKQKREAEQKSIVAGKKSQKEEVFRIADSVVKAVVMQLLAELLRDIIAKLVKWFKSGKRNLDSLLESLNEAIQSFVAKMKMHVINASHTAFATIGKAIGDEIFNTVRRACTIFKQGWKSLEKAVNYLKSPENKGKPIGRLMLEVGKIVIAGMAGIGALFLSETIENALSKIPLMKKPIPLFGTLANILGMFFGAVVAGIIGAIAINLIEKKIAKKQKADNTKAQLDKGNAVIVKQGQIQIVNEVRLERDKESVQSNISERHQEAFAIMKDTYENVMEDFVEDFSEKDYSAVVDEEDVITIKKLDKLSDDLDDLLAGLN